MKTKAIFYVLITLISNIILSSVKILIGILTGSIAIMADGINNLTDAMTNIIGIISIKISNKPADREHPFGHARVEYIASIIIAMFIIFSGISFLAESIKCIINPNVVEYDVVVFIILIISILVKIGLYFYNQKGYKNTNNMILKSISYDSLSDCLTTSVIIIAILIGLILNISVDGYIGIGVSIYIMYSGIKIIKEESDVLLGSKPDPSLEDAIINIVKQNKEVLDVHDLIIHSYGRSKKYATIHVCMDGSKDVYYLHEIIDSIERIIKTTLGVDLIIHLDPMKVDDQTNKKIWKILNEITKDHDNIIEFHDMRVVDKHHQEYIYVDALIKYDTKIDVKMISNIINSNLDKDYIINITIDYK